MRRISLFAKRFYAGLFLGAGFISKLKAAFGLVLISRIYPITFRIKTSDESVPVTIATGSDAAMFVELFYDREYSLPSYMQPKTILDIGANVGFASLFFATEYPAATIISLEPDPANYATLCKNIQSQKQVTTIAAAVAPNSGEKDFYPVQGQGMSSSFNPRFNSKKISVKTFSIDALLDKMEWKELDLLKFDIEGAEWDVFSTVSLKRIKALVGEFHADLTGHSVEEFIALFPGFRSKILKQMGQRCIVLLSK